MAFDLSTARIAKPAGFDMATAKVADPMVPRSPPETRPRAEVEAELAQRQAASAAADKTNSMLNVVEPLVRGTGQALTGLAKGVVGLPAMVEDAVAAIDARVSGVDDNPRFFRGSMDFLSPPELAPRNAPERFTSTASEIAGGALSGTAAGGAIAASPTAGPVARAVGTALTEMPGRQGISALTGAGAGTAAHEAGAGPLTEMLATVLGGGAAFAGAKPNAGFGTGPITPGGRGVRPHGPEVELARQMGIPLAPDAVAAQHLRYAPDGGVGGVPGRFRSSVAGPEADFTLRANAANRITNLAARELGLPEGKITPEAIEAVRAPANAIFDRTAREVPMVAPDAELMQAIEGLGANPRNNPLLETSRPIEILRERLATAGPVETQFVLDAIRQWRRNARTLFQSADDPAKHEMAGAYRAAADAFESAIERTATATGNPQLVADLRGARTVLAKTHNVEDALVGTDVDAGRLAKIGEKAPLSGVLADIATVGTNFGDSVRPIVGAQYPTPSLTQSLINRTYLGRRLGGERLIPGMLEDPFQNQFGMADPNYGMNPGRPDFPPSPPAAPPPAPPPGGRFPWTPAGEGPLSLADEIGGGVPFSETQLPPTGGDGVALVDQGPPDFFGASDIPDTGGLALEDALAGPDMRPAIPGYAAEPFSPTQNGAPGLQPGTSVGMADPLMPEPGPFGPDPGPFPRGPNDATPFGRGPKAGGRGATPDNLGFAPDNAYELPNLGDLIAGLKQGGPESPYGKLPAELQALADVLTGAAPEGSGNASGDLFAALGTEPGPPGPMAPPKGSRGLGDIFSGLDATAEPTGQAAPADFGDLIPPEALGFAPPKPKAPKAAKAAAPAKLRVDDSAPANAIKDRHIPPGSLLISQGPKGNPSRWIALERIDGRLRTRSINAERYKAENPGAKGAGKELYLEAARQAAERKLPWDMDSSLTKDAFYALDSLFRDGRLQAEGWDKVRQQLLDIYEAGDNVAKNPAGDKPWIEDIRLGPTE